jgi:hypothetical protein
MYRGATFFASKMNGMQEDENRFDLNRYECELCHKQHLVKNIRSMRHKIENIALLENFIEKINVSIVRH